jgi:hypothetical protein
MKTSMFAALLLASTFIAGGAAAQPAPFNATGVTMGHWHIISNNVDANKKLFLAMGAKMFDVGGNPLMMFPSVYINLNLGQEKGEGGTVGSVVNHVGFIVNNVQEQVAKWKAAGVPVLPGTNNRPDQAFVVTPDCVRIEILEDKNQTVPVKNTSTCSCRKAISRRRRLGTARPSAALPALAIMPRWWTAFRACRFASPRPIPPKRRPAIASSITSAST